MRLTVVVPSLGRPESLTACLGALRRQTRQADECLVVAQRGDAPTQSAARAAGAAVVLVDTPGLVAALNAGLEASRGDVVAFTDDDTRARGDWLERIERAFEEDPLRGGVGGRDWVHYDGLVDARTARVVGRLSWYGRMTGNHHLGAGPPRDVAFLKGANMAFRRAALGPTRFDGRLRGDRAQHATELGVSFDVLRRGWRLRYDPQIAVDHYLAPRPEGREMLDPERLRMAAHNEALAVLEHLPAPGGAAFMAWAALVGTGPLPGLAQALRRPARARRVLRAARVVRAGRRDARRAVRAGSGERVLAIAHSTTGAERARQLLEDRDLVTVVTAAHGSVGGARAALTVAARPATTVYLVDVGRSTVVAAIVARLLGRRVVLDTGDLAHALARSVGGRGRAGLAAVAWGERAAVAAADHVVVRGHGHLRHLRGRRATCIPDLAPGTTSTRPAGEVRARLGLDGEFVVGLVGSLNHSARLGVSYGWDLVEALALCPPGVSALIVGDGSGLPWLRERAARLGVLERCRFTGRIEPGLVAPYVAAMDAAISTQSADAVGEVRTTGKLPLYLALGCPVIATHVGEAARLLGPLGWTLPYTGVVDPDHPQRLAERIARWSAEPEAMGRRREAAQGLAVTAFDASEMRERLGVILDGVGR